MMMILMIVILIMMIIIMMMIIINSMLMIIIMIIMIISLAAMMPAAPMIQNRHYRALILDSSPIWLLDVLNPIMMYTTKPPLYDRWKSSVFSVLINLACVIEVNGFEMPHRSQCFWKGGNHGGLKRPGWIIRSSFLLISLWQFRSKHGNSILAERRFKSPF